MQRFWMVLGNSTPVAHHSTIKSAMNEAERLARLNPTSKFIVLEAVAQCRYSQVTWEQADETSDARGTVVIPF